MRFNTNRSGRFGFGALVDDYDLGRQRLRPEFVQDVRRRLGAADVRAERSVLEVGAGTGQLTEALLDAGGHPECSVTAVEPSEPLRSRLEQHRADDLRSGRLRTVDVPFEECAAQIGGDRFDELWSADAFHWIDPELAYPTARRLLRSGGLIVLLWSFPILADARVQESLNQLYLELSPDLVRDPATFADDLEPALRGGREQLAAADGFEPPVSWTDQGVWAVSAGDYVALQCSYGQVANLRAAEFDALRQGILERLPTDRVELTERRYVLAARATGR